MSKVSMRLRCIGWGVVVAVNLVSLVLVLRLDKGFSEGFAGRLFEKTAKPNSSCRSTFKEFKGRPEIRGAFFVISDTGYLNHSVITAYSLKKTLTKYEVVLLTTTEPFTDYQTKIARVFDRIIPHSHIPGHSPNNWHKFHAWNHTEYDKIVILGSDMVVLKNIDHLMLCDPTPCAVPDMTLLSSYLSHAPAHPSKRAICKLLSVNSDLMVISPSKDHFAEIVRYTQPHRERKLGAFFEINPWTSEWPGPYDQAWLNYVFGGRITYLRWTYNILCYLITPGWKIEPKDWFILHFATTSGMAPDRIKSWTSGFRKLCLDYNRNFTNEYTKWLEESKTNNISVFSFVSQH